MELSFVLNALRRFWWVTVLCIAVIAGPVVALKGASDQVFMSKAVLLISPPSTSSVDTNGNSDRYIAGELSVLGSDLLSQAVATKVGEGATSLSVRLETVIAETPSTDIVTVTVTDPSATRATAIAAAYVSEYFAQLQTQLNDAQDSQEQTFDDRLAAITKSLKDVDAKIAAVIAPYLPSGPIDANEVYPPIPTADQVAPDLVSEKQNLLAEYSQIQTQKATLDATKLQITSRVVQPASVPGAATVQKHTLLIAASIIAGIGLGVVLAVIVARVSPWVLDVEQMERILEDSTVVVFPNDKKFGADRLAALTNPSPESHAFLEKVCVQAESYALANQAFTIAVVGTQRGVGTTTIATSMAAVFAASGSDVVLVDADTRDAEISRLFEKDPTGTTQQMSVSDIVGRSADPMVPIPSEDRVAGLAVVGQHDAADVDALHRTNIPDLILAMSWRASIVVFDGGPLMDSASSLRLSRAVDVIVLAVPLRRQRTKALAAIARQLQGNTAGMLSVITPTRGT